MQTTVSSEKKYAPPRKTDRHTTFIVNSSSKRAMRVLSVKAGTSDESDVQKASYNFPNRQTGTKEVVTFKTV